MPTKRKGKIYESLCFKKLKIDAEQQFDNFVSSLEKDPFYQIPKTEFYVDSEDEFEDYLIDRVYKQLNEQINFTDLKPIETTNKKSKQRMKKKSREQKRRAELKRRVELKRRAELKRLRTEIISMLKLDKKCTKKQMLESIFKYIGGDEVLYEDSFKSFGEGMNRRQLKNYRESKVRRQRRNIINKIRDKMEKKIFYIFFDITSQKISEREILERFIKFALILK